MTNTKVDMKKLMEQLNSIEVSEEGLYTSFESLQRDLIEIVRDYQDSEEALGEIGTDLLEDLKEVLVQHR